METDEVQELFATETMAELCARQGRAGDAVAIYRRLLSGAPDQERRTRWTARMAELEGAGGGAATPASPAPAAARPAATAPLRPAAEPAHRMPMVVRQPVRSGQIVYAEKNDLIVLGPVNPGAQLIADGNIHVYGPLRGRAVAGAHGATDARIFCLRLDAELVGIDAAYLASEHLPPERVGKAAQIQLQDGRCVVTPL